jgi:replicative DNA helicase
MDHERALITKVLRMKSGMRKAVDAGITVDHFEDDSSKRAWLWCVGYWKEYGQRPTEEAFVQDYPAYRLTRIAEPLDYVIDQLHERRRYNLLVDMLTAVSTVLDEDEPIESRTKRAAKILREQMSSIEIISSQARDTNVAKTMTQRLDRYRDMEKNKGKLLGIPTGYQFIDLVGGGWQPEQLITLFGLSKGGKSIILMNMAVEALAQGYDVLFIGYEMSNAEQELRFDGMNAGINYRKIMGGNLTKRDWDDLIASMKVSAAYGDFVLTSDASRGMTVSSIAAKAEQHWPDVIFIDGTYLMDDEDGAVKGSSQSLTNITRGLKRTAQKMRIPIIGSTQALSWKRGAKSKGLTSDTIGYTSSYVQDSDLVIAVFQEEGRDDEIKLRVTENRMGGKGECTARWDFDTMNFEQVDMMFGEFSVGGEVDGSI